jgi:hypothetical protein
VLALPLRDAREEIRGKEPDVLSPLAQGGRSICTTFRR